MKFEFIKISRSFVSPCLLLCCAILTMGISQCDMAENEENPLEWLEEEADQEPAKSVISIHSIIKYPRGDFSIEKKVRSYFGPDVCINSIPLLSSQDIRSIKMVPRGNDPDMYDLLLTLSDRGRKMWIALSVANKNTQLAFAVDGMIYRKFVPRLLYDDTTFEILVDGPFDPATAMELQKSSKKNYKKMNRK